MSREILHTSFIEGPSCSGKTSLLKSIDDDKVAIIFKKWPSQLTNPPVSFFLERDEDKLRRAKEASLPTKLVDRGYLSTLTFYTVLEEQEGVSAMPVYRWFVSEMGKGLYRPSSYIFVDIPAEITLQRAIKSGRNIVDNNMWFKYPERIKYWYEKLLGAFEPATTIFRLDGSRDQKLVESEFKELVDNLKKGIE